MDELFVMFDRERDPWLVLHIASGDVAALCGRIGNTNNGISYVAAQWTWDAYGNVFSADHIAPHPFVSVGHKGLFVERLDVGVADASVPGSQGWHQHSRTIRLCFECLMRNVTGPSHHARKVGRDGTMRVMPPAKPLKVTKSPDGSKSFSPMYGDSRNNWRLDPQAPTPGPG